MDIRVITKRSYNLAKAEAVVDEILKRYGKTPNAVLIYNIQTYLDVRRETAEGYFNELKRNTNKYKSDYFNLELIK